MKRKYAAIIMTVFMSVAVTGCGMFGFLSKDKDEEPETPETTETAPDADSSSDTSDTAASPKPSVHASSEESAYGDEMVGEWVYVCSMYHSEYDDEEDYDYCEMCTDPDAAEAAIIIRKDGDRYLADYKYIQYESSTRIYGSELKFKDKSPYEGWEYDPWYMEMTDAFADDDMAPIRLSMTDDDMLVESREYWSEPDDEFWYHSTYTTFYLKAGSPRLDDLEELKYFDTVTVSNAADLLNSIQNNRKIILESGTYDLSRVAESEVNNSNVGIGYSSYSFDGVSNLRLEAADGADVLICVDDPYDPVLWFDNGRNISLDGLTVGHNVEPGYCSGSVLYFQYITGLEINNCNLYGSGTYGIEATGTYDINVTDTDIYECTYGLLDLYSMGSANFKNCTFRDSSGFDMISVYSAYDVTFEDCEFTNNVCEYDDENFVEIGEYDSVTFRNCTFSNNKYSAFSNRPVTVENCTSDTNYGDIIDATEVSSADDLLKLYDQACDKQQEIDDKVENDPFMDQLSLNQCAFEEYDLWDSLINQIWSYLGENLDEDTMTALTEEQREWIKEKEAQMKAAGEEASGGSMQSMLEYGNGSKITRKRVEYLLDQYVK